MTNDQNPKSELIKNFQSFKHLLDDEESIKLNDL